MPQIQLPIFPSNSTAITNELAFQEREGTVWYVNGHLPVFKLHQGSDPRLVGGCCRGKKSLSKKNCG